MIVEVNIGILWLILTSYLTFVSQKWKWHSQSLFSSSFALVWSLTADEANFSSKPSVANRTSQFWQWRIWWWSLGSSLALFAVCCFLQLHRLYLSLHTAYTLKWVLRARLSLRRSHLLPFWWGNATFSRSHVICSQESGGMLKSFRETFKVSL